MKFLTRVLLFTLTYVGMSAHAHALEPLNVNGKFDLYAGQVPVGKMSWIVREDAELNTYFSYAKLRTTGLARLISKQRREMKVAGIMDKHGYIPTNYEYHSGTGKKRHIELGYNEKRKRIHRINTPEDGAGRPQVTLEEAFGSVDPLTALVQMRFELDHLLASDTQHPSASFPIYDGRRLMRGNLQRIGTAQMMNRETEISTHWITLTRTPIAGFSEKELNKIAKEPEPQITVYFSKDEALIPLMFEVDSTLTLRAFWDSDRYNISTPHRKTREYIQTDLSDCNRVTVPTGQGNNPC